MMKKILISCCLALCTLAAWAAKANPIPVTVTQSDGTQLTVYQYGDEHFSWISRVSPKTQLQAYPLKRIIS